MGQVVVQLDRLSFPAVGGLFLVLYLGSLANGTTAEAALVRAGLASLLAAGVIRVAWLLIEAALRNPPTSRDMRSLEPAVRKEPHGHIIDAIPNESAGANVRQEG